MKNKIFHFLDLANQLIKLPVANLNFCAHIKEPNVMEAYAYFTKRHPKYKIFQNKAWGVALIDLTNFQNSQEYMEQIKGHNNGAYFAKKARTRGYTVTEINRNNFIDAIHEINTCIEIRQGRPMDSAYTQKKTFYKDDKNYKYYGAFDKEGKLVAYCNIGFYGNFAVANQLLGYRNNHGVMHFMLIEIICKMIDKRALNYFMYDTFFGAQPGLKTFKTILGFKPYRARYSMQNSGYVPDLLENTATDIDARQ